ncbi:Holliday junction resolvase RuvX [Cellulosilyticum sp. ST5]|uniref:Putative pre-16S rRNA nuclease n=1 Tax=Cellulosilyticum lentocellum (strain ATCC 49066 / DSM 5427 / NCIMB 11756 / RHM5) TaxID=642492 RepID=F2JQZ6_CELLD|nr:MULTISPECIES: Holliday junction resolvase RuvX [Cellulosilyticum]ADZ83854.1 Holliday junction resolvase [Cellulosilyticum lentocellum DSM 5427]QEH69243.1 Holliday junction resolvase RuvX [Cellulosilyticum sp. WCF-2]
MRILGLDFGTKTTGVAISDPMGWTAQGLEIIRRQEDEHLKATMKRIEEICTAYKVEKIVLGLPKNMNNTLGERGEKTLLFKEKLENKLKIPVETWDERLSTVAAEQVLLEADMSRKKRKNVIDKLAATIILQNYLDAKQ